MYYTFIKKTTEFSNTQLSLFENNIPRTSKTHIITVNVPDVSDYLKDKAAEKEKEFIKITDHILKQAPKTYISMQEHYMIFKIPKKTGGFREISAPSNELKIIQQRIAQLLSYNLSLLAHTAAYAYISGRSHIDAIKTHQQNNARWFLKLDIKNFFPSCTKDLILNNLKQLYPFALWETKTLNKLALLIDLCCLNGALPQGSPASPLLSNLLFVIYDYKIQHFLNHTLTNKKYVYTRYADDILISAKTSFDFRNILAEIQHILHPAFTLKNEKTRYGSIAGRNWNLGLMLNKDNNITTGAVNKRKIKAMLCNFIIAEKANTLYTVPQIQHLQGILNYAKQIEPDYINFLIEKYSHKYEFDILGTIKYRLRATLR